MHKSILAISIFLFLFACQQNKPGNKEGGFTMRSYVDIGQVFDTIQPPVVIDVKNGNKRIVFIGCEHQADTTHQQFLEIERLFNDLKPEISFNEGGQVYDKVFYKNRNEAIIKDGETGLLKFLSDKSGIKMLNGDLTDSLEFNLTLKQFSKEEMLLYYGMERIAIPYRYNAYEDKPFAEVYDRLIEKYFAKEGFPLSADEKTISHFKSIYKKYINQDFDINTIDVEAFDYVNGNCKFCEIGRASKIIRDSVLLSKIDNALDKHDRVMITFGHGHALAVEPALKEIILKKRK